MNTLNQYTAGLEFYQKGTTEEYVGYYNVVGETIYTGRSWSEDSTELVRIPTDTISYKTVKDFPLPPQIVAFVPEPKDADYKRGWFTRYFVRQTNELNAPYIEVDEAQYNKVSNGQNPLYVGVNIRWKISGVRNDVIDPTTGNVTEAGVSNTNDRSIRLVENKHKGLGIRLQNLLQYWNGQPTPHFVPTLDKTPSGELVYKSG